jgi:hypothetical protein
MDAAVMPLIRRKRRLQLHPLAYNFGDFLRTLATPGSIKNWSLTSLKEKLIKIGAKGVSHGCCVAFQMADQMTESPFRDICSPTYYGSLQNYSRCRPRQQRNEFKLSRVPRETTETCVLTTQNSAPLGARLRSRPEAYRQGTVESQRQFSFGTVLVPVRLLSGKCHAQEYANYAATGDER